MSEEVAGDAAPGAAALDPSQRATTTVLVAGQRAVSVLRGRGGS